MESARLWTADFQSKVLSVVVFCLIITAKSEGGPKRNEAQLLHHAQLKVLEHRPHSENWAFSDSICLGH
jgi:hypothetical protein